MHYQASATPELDAMATASDSSETREEQRGSLNPVSSPYASPIAQTCRQPLLEADYPMRFNGVLEPRGLNRLLIPAKLAVLTRSIFDESVL